MANANRTNLSLLKERAAGRPYLPAKLLQNTLLDPAVLIFHCPAGTRVTTGVYKPELLPATGFAAGRAGLYELPPAQAPKGLLVQKGTADATPAWIDGFAAVPYPLSSDGEQDWADAIASYQDALLAFFGNAAIIWKGDEQILRTMFCGDMQRRELAFTSLFQTALAATDMVGFGNNQAACAAPGGPVYKTNGYVWTGRASAEWYLQIGSGFTPTKDLDFKIYVYGQFILNIDPLQAGTYDLIMGGTFGAAAGSCEDNIVAAVEGARASRMAPAQKLQAGSAVTRTVRCGS